MIDSESVIKNRAAMGRREICSSVFKQEEHFGSSNYRRFCEERNLMFVERNLNPSRFLLIEDEHHIGTVECMRYTVPEQSNSEFFYPFSKNDLVKDLQNVYEIGKLSIAKRLVGGTLQKTNSYFIYAHGVETSRMVYRSGYKRMYMYLLTLGFPIEPIDKPFQFHDTLQGAISTNSCPKGYAFVLL